MMTCMQGVGLWAFTSISARYGPNGRHVTVFLLWTGMQAGFLFLLGMWNLTLLERVLPHGFELRRMWLELYHADVAPGPLGMTQWLPLLSGILLATVGSLATGGLTGSWLAAHGTNYASYFLAGLVTISGLSNPTEWLPFVGSAFSLGQIVLLSGLWFAHLALCPYLWRWPFRQELRESWKMQRPMLGLGLATSAAGGLLMLI